MEKEYFSNRTPESVRRDSVIVGELAYICEKEMQKKARTIDDLTLVRITQNLTSQAIHPRGQKVRGRDYTTGEEKVGRAVYLLRDGKVLTAEGEKYAFELYGKEFRR